MKKSKCLLISALIGTAYLIYMFSYFGGGLSSTTGADQVGMGIATALVLPHFFLLFLAVLFNWIGFFGKAPWAALTGGILYCVSGLLFLIYVVFEIPSIVLSFIGYARQKKAKAIAAATPESV